MIRIPSNSKRSIPEFSSTILVVDDSAYIRCFLANILGDAGYETLFAGDGVVAIDLLAECQVDAIVTDLEMPLLSGRELVDHVRAGRPAIPHDLPIVVCSSQADQDTRRRLLHAGADVFLAKPVDRQELLSVVNQLLQSNLPPVSGSGSRLSSDRQNR
jgi:CheY-like chemotaxis protein